MDTITITAVAPAGTLTATIGVKSLVYTVTGTDTTATAAANFAALLTASAATAPEFGEITFAVVANVITATAAAAGTPFTLTATASGGGTTLTQTHTQANVSPSDVSDANNWWKSGAAGLPANGDDMVIADSNVSLLWNLNALAAVTLNSVTQFMSFTGSVGLPENNSKGYVEYRPTYFKLLGGAGTLTVVLGQPSEGGTGPGRLRFNFQAQHCNFLVLGSGSALDSVAIRLLGTSAANTLFVTGNTSVVMADLPAETSALTSATVEGPGSTLILGSGCTVSGAVTVNAASATILTAPGSLIAQQQSSVLVAGEGAGAIATVKASEGSVLTWNSDSNIITLILATSAILDKSGDLRAIAIANSTVDGDTCQINDPWNTITYTSATTINNTIDAGPFIVGRGRTVKIT